MVLGGMKRNGGLYGMLAVRGLVATQNAAFDGSAVYFVAEHFDDPTYMVGFIRACGLGARGRIKFDRGIDLKREIHPYERRIGAFAFGKLQHGFIAARHRQDEQAHGV